MPGIPDQSLRSVNHWFPSSYYSREIEGPAVPNVQLFNNLTTSTSIFLVEKQVQRTFRHMMNDMFFFSRMPSELHRFNSILGSLDVHLNLLGGPAPLVSQYHNNVAWLNSLYETNYTSATVDQQDTVLSNIWINIDDSHKHRVVLGLNSYTAEDITYYYENQGGYDTLLTLFAMLANWSATHMRLPNVYRNGTNASAATLLAPSICWRAVKRAQNNTQEIPDFEYKLYPRATYLRT